jgi:hypothetical protein
MGACGVARNERRQRARHSRRAPLAPTHAFSPAFPPPHPLHSFFMAETLKYLYMLQASDHTISLDKYVFNTEAHPLSVFTA